MSSKYSCPLLTLVVIQLFSKKSSHSTTYCIANHSRRAPSGQEKVLPGADWRGEGGGDFEVKYFFLSFQSKRMIHFKNQNLDIWCTLTAMTFFTGSPSLLCNARLVPYLSGRWDDILTPPHSTPNPPLSPPHTHRTPPHTQSSYFIWSSHTGGCGYTGFTHR